MAFESEDQVRVRAYHLWEANGRPEGRDLEFWEQARQSTPPERPVGKKRRSSQSSSAELAVAKAEKRSKRRAKKHSD